MPSCKAGQKVTVTWPHQAMISHSLSFKVAKTHPHPCMVLEEHLISYSKWGVKTPVAMGWESVPNGARENGQPSSFSSKSILYRCQAAYALLIALGLSAPAIKRKISQDIWHTLTHIVFSSTQWRGKKQLQAAAVKERKKYIWRHRHCQLSLTQ